MRLRTKLALCAVLGHGCGALSPSPVALRPGSPAALLPVLAPESEADDDPGLLTNNSLAAGGWYCSGARAPQRFEVMFRDGAARPVRAVGFVLGNAGPGAPGPFTVRVQRGHGVVAPGVAFRVSAEALGGDERDAQGASHSVPGAGPSGARRFVVELPVEARGDHVLLRFDGRPRRATARCLGELEVYAAGEPLPGADEARRVTAVVEPARPDAGDPDGAGPDASAETNTNANANTNTNGSTDADPSGDAAAVGAAADAEVSPDGDATDAAPDDAMVTPAAAPSARPRAPRR